MSRYVHIGAAGLAVLAVSLLVMRQQDHDAAVQLERSSPPVPGAAQRSMVGSTDEKSTSGLAREQSGQTRSQEQALSHRSRSTPETRPAAIWADTPAARSTSLQDNDEDAPEAVELAIPSLEESSDLLAAEITLETALLDDLSETDLSTEAIEEVLSAVLPASPDQDAPGVELDMTDEELEAEIATNLADAGESPNRIDEVLDAVLPYTDDADALDEVGLVTDLVTAGTPSDEIDAILTAVNPDVSGN